jgi:hypothetical protein
MASGRTASGNCDACTNHHQNPKADALYPMIQDIFLHKTQIYKIKYQSPQADVVKL